MAFCPPGYLTLKEIHSEYRRIGRAHNDTLVEQKPRFRSFLHFVLMMNFIKSQSRRICIALPNGGVVRCEHEVLSQAKPFFDRLHNTDEEKNSFLDNISSAFYFVSNIDYSVRIPRSFPTETPLGFDRISRQLEPFVGLPLCWEASKNKPLLQELASICGIETSDMSRLIRSIGRPNKVNEVAQYLEAHSDSFFIGKTAKQVYLEILRTGKTLNVSEKTVERAIRKIRDERGL